MRVLLLGSYPSWPYREAIGLRRDTRHITTTWNVSLLKALAAREDVDVHLATLCAGIPGSKKLCGDGFTLHFLAMSRWRKALDLANSFRGAKTRIAKVVRDVNPALIHGIGTEHPYGHVADQFDLPSVITVHGMTGEIVKHVPGERWGRNGIYARYERQTLKRSRALISISPYVSQNVARGDGQLHFQIPNPLGESFFQGPTVPLSARRLDLLFVGTFQARKGLHVLMEALGRLRAQGSAISVGLMGAVRPSEGQYQGELERQAMAHGVADWIEWYPPSGAEMVARRMSQARALVLPSLEETAPMVIAEALSQGTPVIASDVGGVADMISGCDEAGVLCRPGDPVSLADGISRIPSFWAGPNAGECRRLHADKYRPDQIARMTVSAYKTVLSHGS